MPFFAHLFFFLLCAKIGLLIGICQEAHLATRRENLIKNKNRILYWIAELDRCIHEIAISGTASASLSAGGGSQSYTHADLEKLQKLRGRYASRLEQINMALSAVPNSTGIRHVVTVRCGLGGWF